MFAAFERRGKGVSEGQGGGVVKGGTGGGGGRGKGGRCSSFRQVSAVQLQCLPTLWDSPPPAHCRRAAVRSIHGSATQ